MGCLKLAYRTDYTALKVVQGGLYASEKGCAGSYRYGYNTQEKVDEISGSGNHYTAEFWEYNPRVVMRWNQDPVKRADKSPYVINSNNPITNSDPNGDCDDCPKAGTSASAKVSLSFNFGTKGQSNFSIGAGVGLSANSGNFMGSLNISGRFYGGGLGTTGTTGGQTGLNMDIVASPALTFGKGTATPMTLNTFNSETSNLTGVSNSFKSSFTLGSNLVAGGEGNQRVGSVGFRSGDLSLHTSNDFFPGLGDRNDRFWTGSLMASVNLGGGNTLSGGYDGFTGERIGSEGNYSSYSKGGFNYYQQSARGVSLTNGQTFLQLNNSKGLNLRANYSGTGLMNPMYLQNGIHDNFPTGRINRFESFSPGSLQIGGGITGGGN